ncbi:MAG: diacylglycerol kinase family protein [Acidimicrobiales bacterium]
MRILVVVNTAASAVTPRRRDAVLRHLALGHDLDVVGTERRGHATDLARSGLAAGVDAVAVLGGDGTVNEVASALVATDTVLAPLPGGSTNVFVRSIGLPRDPALAAERTARALSRRRVDRIRVGTVDADGAGPRPFLCHTGIGWDAALVAEVERLRGRHRRLRFTATGGPRPATVPLYVRAGVRTFVSGWDRRHPSLHVGSSDPAVAVDGYFTLVMNSDPYTFVGPWPLRVAPTADRHHPLAAVVATSMTVAAFGPVVARAFLGRRGLRPGHAVAIHPDVEELTVTATGPHPLPFQVDGDHLGEASQLVLASQPDAMSVVDPCLRSGQR